jgi:hypothetical protein
MSRSLSSKYLDNLEQVTREAVQPMPREIKHRDQKPVMRRLDAENNDLGGNSAQGDLDGAAAPGHDG